MTTKPPSQDLDKIIIRLPHGMRDKLKASAQTLGVTMNAYIVDILTDYLVPASEEFEAIRDELNRAMIDRLRAEEQLAAIKRRQEELAGRLNEREAERHKRIREHNPFTDEVNSGVKRTAKRMLKALKDQAMDETDPTP